MDNIVINQTNATGGNAFTYNLQTNIDMSNAELAFASIDISYSWQNINSTYGNNTFSLIFPTSSGTTTYNITLPNRGYRDASDLNNYLRYWFISQGLYITNNTTGDITVYAEFVENAPAYSIDLVCYAVPSSLPSGYTNASISFPATPKTPQFVINNSAFGDTIGYDNGTYPSGSGSSATVSFSSSKCPQFSPVQSIMILVDAVYNRSASESTVIHSFSPAGVAYGNIIKSTPPQYAWAGLQNGSRQSITVRLVDQLYRPINIYDKNLCMRFVLREKPLA